MLKSASTGRYLTQQQLLEAEKIKPKVYIAEKDRDKIFTRLYNEYNVIKENRENLQKQVLEEQFPFQPQIPRSSSTAQAHPKLIVIEKERFDFKTKTVVTDKREVFSDQLKKE